jgi:hypothetical protein
MLSPLRKGSYVRRHARAASAGGSTGRTSAHGFSTLLVTLCLGALALLSFTTAAFGATVTQRPLLFTIDGASVADPPMNGGSKLAVDNATGALYLNEGNGVTVDGNNFSRIFRFHADGTPWPFPSTGLPYLEPPGQRGFVNGGVAVDNSGGPNQSRIYAVDRNEKLYAIDPSGELLWAVSLPNPPADVAVDLTGHPYVSPLSGYSTIVRKYDNTGSPPALIESIPMTMTEFIDLNTVGDVFLGVSSVEKWVGGSFSSTVDPLANDVHLDQSTPGGHIFTTYEGRNERQVVVVDATAGQFRLSFGGEQTSNLPFDATEEQIAAALQALPAVGAGSIQVDFTPEPPNAKQVTFKNLLGQTNVDQLVCEDGATPLSGGAGCSVSTVEGGVSSDAQEYAADGTFLETFGVGDLVDAASVAYNPSLDRIYALQGSSASLNPSVVAFGPITTGTAPDATIDAPSGIGVSTAHFSGTVNPQGTTSEWRFQWRKAGEGWAAAPSSPPQSLPQDSSDHAVEYTTNALRGSTPYQVRLVAENTENQLIGVSASMNFATTEAAQAPEATIAAPSAITADGATITGTVNPQGDTADWQVQTSTDPACASGFGDEPLQTISPSSASPVAVEYEVTGLLPSEHYCVRILATNSAGSTTSETKEFETLEAQPSQVFAAYAAPRTDTAARLNGYVNPEGSETTYRFEYSLDGSTWTALPDEQTREAHRQIVVASELSGLSPATTYHYRFVVENDGGTVQSDEKTFATRTVAEVQLPQRGIELVSNPDKGNQNIAPESTDRQPFVSRDGNRAVWKVYAGAPGGNTGTEVNFLSIRTESGWRSQSLSPPAAQQVGGGERAYKLWLAAPDLRTFLMRAVQTVALGEGPPTFVRIDDQGQQDILKEFTKESSSGYENADMTSDGAHVVTFNVETRQLEEIGTEPHEVVSIMPDGQPAECGLNSNDFFGTGGTGVAGGLWRFPDYHRMATTDAARLYFQALPNGGSCTEDPQHHPAIYYRDRNVGQTVEIDPGTATTAPGLIRATPDGRSVLFATATSHSPEDENTGGDIYRWDSDGDTYTCLTCVVDEAAVSGGGGGGVFTNIASSPDLSHVYFASQRQLVSGHGMLGESSIYAVSNGELNYVAPGPSYALTDVRVSDDGNVLLFSTSHSSGQYVRLTADDQADECTVSRRADAKEPGCQLLFRYEDSTNSLECLSCLPGGVTTHDAGGSSEIALSKDGSTAAFVTYERLLPHDITGRCS